MPRNSVSDFAREVLKVQPDRLISLGSGKAFAFIGVTRQSIIGFHL